ncbi:MAG: DMT family transporter [Acetobacteraceae bacterium]|nr:DMT family transporter [Acetobacteraceae bacterium]
MGPATKQILPGILFMCAAGLVFPVMGGFAKLLGQDYSSLQVSWARAFGHVLFLSAMLLPRFGLGILRTQRPGLQLARSALLFAANLAFFAALTFIPLADAATIGLMSPLVVALLAWPLLGERTTRLRVAALCAGFAGVLVVLRPGTELFHPAALLVLFNACAYALYQMLTRIASRHDRPETSAIWSSVVGAFVMLAVLPFVWITPRNGLDLLLFCGIGAIGGLGHYFVARAFGLAPANIVSPFQYFQLIGAVAVGWLFFGDLPDPFVWAGAAIIVGAGLAIGWGETRRGPAGPRA